MTDIMTFLKKSRMKLNLILVSSWFLRMLFLGSIFSIIIILAGKILGFPDMDYLRWLLITVSVGMIGIFIGLKKRLTLKKSARWVDNNLKEYDIFSSALICIDRLYSGLFDDSVVKMAESVLQKKIKIKWPFNEIIKRFLLTSFSCIICIILVFFYDTFVRGQKFSNYFNNNNSFERYTDDNIQNGKKTFFKDNRSPREIADSIFPDNKKSADMANNAISSGDDKLLQELLKQENLKLDEMLKKAETISEKEKIINQQKKNQEIADSLKEQNTDKNKTSQDKKNGQSEQNKDEQNGSDQKNTKEKNVKSNDEGKTGKDGKTDQSQSDGGIPGKSKGQSDNGESTEITKRDMLKSESSKKELLITQKKDSPEFEFLLPDKKTKLPLVDLIPDSKKSFESAVIRKGIPVEYEDFVQSYFISLTQEMEKNIQNKKEGKNE
jgi:hypothetical protein